MVESKAKGRAQHDQIRTHALRWTLVAANGRGPYLAGMESSGRMRTSTPLVEFDPAAGTALTVSGRPYRLASAADPEYGLAVAREVWSQVFDLTGSVISPLTVDEAGAMITENRNQPYNRTLEEEVALAREYGIPHEDIGTVIPLDVDDLIIPDPEDGEDEIEAYGRGNVFADLGLDNPDVRLVKADAAISIATLLHEHHLTIEQAAELAGMEPDMLRGIVEHGRVDGLSLERLDKIVEALEAAPGSGRKL